MTSAARHELRRSYASAFQAYLYAPSERTLRTAYELGRQAVARELSVLDLALVHHESLASALRSARPDDLERLARLAADFLLEGLSAFEMIRRAYAEARDRAASERRQANMLRQLSNLLTDTSLTFDASGSLEEVIRLVAEQARELTHASCCVVALSSTGDGPTIEAAAYEEGDEAAAAFTHSADLPALARLIDPSRHSARMSRDDLVVHAGSRNADLVAGWLGALLTTLDGREIGWIQLYGSPEAEFTELDEAVLAHVAQMTSATVERVWLYDR
jgi:hypothetical protein